MLLAVSLALPAIALAADTEPAKRLTPADQAKARSLLLKRADFTTGWKDAPGSGADGSDFSCPGFDPDQSDLTLTGEADSDFTNGSGAYVGSMAGLYRSAAEARASWSRSNKPAVTRCLALLIRQTFAQQGATAKATKAGRIAFPRVAPRVAAFRVAVSVSFPQVGRPVPVVLHLVVLGRGRAEVALVAMALGSGIPQADLKAFASLVSQRMAAAKV